LNYSSSGFSSCLTSSFHFSGDLGGGVFAFLSAAAFAFA